jgi:hypothetical protein
MSTLRPVVFFLLAATAGARADTTLPFATVKGGSASNASKPMHKVFRSSEEFANYWAATFGAAPMPKRIDWTRSELVAIHLGNRGSYGYQITVLSVARVGEDTVVNWCERLPAGAGATHARPSSPYVIASFPIQPGKVLFRGVVQDPRKPYGSADAYPIQTFLSGAHCLLKTETTAVLSDRKAMTDLWATAFGSATPPPACDFTKWRLVAVFLGQRPTPGYVPVIDHIARIGPNEVQVTYSETKPDPGKILPQLVTNPFVIIQVPVSADAITVQKA